MPWSQRKRALILGGAGVAGAAAIWLGFGGGRIGAEGFEAKPATHAVIPAVLQDPLTALVGKGEWISRPLRAEDLRGKVVLVNFWTYSCINSLRPVPYLRAWAAKYRARGLVIVGVHAPEFGFEHDLERVRQATTQLGVPYPVVLDSDFAIWRRFRNHAWPGFYFIGADGKVRDRKLGEGDYAASERLIQQLLAEAGAGTGNNAISQVTGTGTEAAPDWDNLHSPETYVGYAKANKFASPGGAKADVSASYAPAPVLALNQWDATGRWTIGGEYATLDAAPGAIGHHFHARDLHMVLGLGGMSRPVRFRVTIDGAAPGADHGTDTDTQGYGIVREDRLYQLVRQARPVADRIFRIEFLDPGVRAYVFTFG